MQTLLAFAFALGILITVHEWGHYQAAVRLGVRVLRFSIGFGPVIGRWRSRRPMADGTEPTEFVLCALPLGGYVRMLDEREGPVAAAELPRAFNRQPLAVRAFIVAAGPLANLVLAAALYAGLYWSGVTEPAAVLAAPIPDSVAARAGFEGGERVLRVALDDADDGEPVASFEALRWRITQAAVRRSDLRLVVATATSTVPSERILPIGTLGLAPDNDLLSRLGITGPWTPPVIAAVPAGGAAARAGLQPGDRVRAIDGVVVRDGQALRRLIQELGRRGNGPLQFEIDRAGQHLLVAVQPERTREGETVVARIGAYVGGPPEMVRTRYGFWEGARHALARVWDMSEVTLRMIARMVVGEASVRNISGPLTIADYAGRTAALGWQAYVQFLAVISVSLGVLNLLPLPVLDGGYLMYYLWEAVTRRPVSPAWMERLQRGGVVLLFLLMSIALYNDISRMLG